VLIYLKGISTPIILNEVLDYPYTLDVFPYYYNLTYVSSGLNTGNYIDTVLFQVKTNNNPNWSNTGILTFNVSYCVQPTTTVGPPSCDIFVPEGFSPSDQNGVHDFFDVYGLWCYPVHRMSIFNRDGDLLYRRTNDYVENPWDGKVNGVLVAGVSRTWVLEINGSVHSTGGVYVG
jgi:hypothetical protein